MSSYYPPVGFHFDVDFNLGEKEADTRFQEITGLTAEMSTEELKEGGVNDFAYKLPVKGKYNNLVLKRGMLLNSEVIKWVRDAIENFSFETTTVTVHLLDKDHQSMAAWKFEEAYPVKLAISDFKAEENAVVVETLELAYQKFTRTQ